MTIFQLIASIVIALILALWLPIYLIIEHLKRAASVHHFLPGAPIGSVHAVDVANGTPPDGAWGQVVYVGNPSGGGGGSPTTVNTAYVDENGNTLTVMRTFANVASGVTASSMIAAVSGKIIRVLSVYALCGGTATTLTFNSNSAAISALLANAANGGEVLPYHPQGWFETAEDQALTVTTSAEGSTTGVGITYVLVSP
jgi:hypothetical protein